MNNDLYIEKLKNIIATEYIYIYIYSHEATFVDLSHNGHIIKNDVAGTIAGDNTIFVLVRTDEKALELISKVRNMIS